MTSSADCGPDLLECPECGELTVWEDFTDKPSQCDDCGADLEPGEDE